MLLAHAAVAIALVACTASAPPPRAVAAPPPCPEPAASAEAPADTPADTADRVPFGADERAGELAALRDAIREVYAHLETKQQQWGVDLDAMYARYEPEIRAAETWARYEWVMVSFVAELHDGHVQWRRTRGAGEGRRRVVRLGLDTQFVGEALIVSGVWPGSHAERAGLARGDRIVAIDGAPIEQRLGVHGSVRSASRTDAARYDFARGWPASRLPADQEPRARRITRERDDGAYQTLEVVPETTPRPGGRPPPIELAWRGEVAVLHVRSLRGKVAATNQIAEDVARDIFAKAKALVVVLRDNDGGFEDNARYLAAQLTPKPVTGGTTRVRLSAQARAEHRAWRDLAEDPARPGWSVQEAIAAGGRAPRALPGRIAVVIDAGCRSSCEQLALLLRAMGARLFGERTGGASGAPVTVVLPHSGARVGIPARAAYDPTGAPIEGRGVAPDERVAPTRADLEAGRDVMLDRAVDHVCPRGPGRC
jgi:carboxyl-terminal processing protease